jgi:hypothetical protein
LCAEKMKDMQQKEDLRTHMAQPGVPLMNELLPALKANDAVCIGRRASLQLVYDLQFRALVVSLLCYTVMSRTELPGWSAVLLMVVGAVLPSLFVRYGNRLPNRPLCLLVVAAVAGFTCGQLHYAGQSVYALVSAIVYAFFYFTCRYVGSDSRVKLAAAALSGSLFVFNVLAFVSWTYESKLNLFTGVLAVGAGWVDWQIKNFLCDVGRFDRCNSAVIAVGITMFTALILNWFT